MNTLIHLKEQAAAELVRSAEELPIQLTVMDIARFLGVGRSTAYKLVHSEGFPAVRFPGCKRLIVPKKLFLDWYVSSFPQEATHPDICGDTSESKQGLENTSGINLAHPPEKCYDGGV